MTAAPAAATLSVVARSRSPRRAAPESFGGIGTLGERSLHAALKRLYAEPGDAIEAKLGRYHIDIRRGDELIEIQTGSFASIRAKLAALLPAHRVVLVHPVAAEKWIVRHDRRGRLLTRRRSPRRADLIDVFDEAVFITAALGHPHLRLDVVLTREEEVQRADGRGSWRRRGHSIRDRRLIEIVEIVRLARRDSWAALLPATLAEPFTNADLAAALRRPRRLAERMTYVLARLGVLALDGRRGRARLYRRV